MQISINLKTVSLTETEEILIRNIYHAWNKFHFHSLVSYVWLQKENGFKVVLDHHWFTINLNDPPKLLQCWWKMYNSQNQVYAATTQYFIQSTLPWDVALAHDIFCICVYYGHITLFYFLQVYGSNSLLQWFWNLHLYNHWL